MMMADPMADIGGGGMHQPQDDGEQSTTTREVFDGMAYQMNMARMERIRSVMGIASGCIVGICGFTGFQGFGKQLLRM
jgi:hypothetical protein